MCQTCIKIIKLLAKIESTHPLGALKQKLDATKIIPLYFKKVNDEVSEIIVITYIYVL